MSLKEGKALDIGGQILVERPEDQPELDGLAGVHDIEQVQVGLHSFLLSVVAVRLAGLRDLHGMRPRAQG
jgi:hypothetical protein